VLGGAFGHAPLTQVAPLFSAPHGGGWHVGGWWAVAVFGVMVVLAQTFHLTFEFVCVFVVQGMAMVHLTSNEPQKAIQQIHMKALLGVGMDEASAAALQHDLWVESVNTRIMAMEDRKASVEDVSTEMGHWFAFLWATHGADGAPLGEELTKKLTRVAAIVSPEQSDLAVIKESVVCALETREDVFRFCRVTELGRALIKRCQDIQSSVKEMEASGAEAVDAEKCLTDILKHVPKVTKTFTMDKFTEHDVKHTLSVRLVTTISRLHDLQSLFRSKVGIMAMKVSILLHYVGVLLLCRTFVLYFLFGLQNLSCTVVSHIVFLHVKCLLLIDLFSSTTSAG
jgi:predicted subunit of tRNA(5-methylaminomethyl-2-thiouridylate) methyltransferase